MNESERLADLERRVQELERNQPNILGPRPIEPVWPVWPGPGAPFDEPIACPSCGMKWQGVMGYCCPNHGCPMGAGPTTCSVSK